MRIPTLLTAALTLAFVLSACFDADPELTVAVGSDAGNYSFVRQAVPKLAGRKARGYAEVKVLADLVSQTNRPTALRAMLLNEDFRREYVDHWSENTVDFMRAHRETEKSQTDPGLCFGPGLRATPDYSPALAAFVRNNAPTATTPPGGSFNFSDLLRSSYSLDDLSPAYRAYLFALVSRPLRGAAEVTEQNRRDDLGATFTRVYTHRQITCLACHTTASSTTDSRTFWNRHFPIRGQFETALFEVTTGRASDEVHAMLRTDVSEGGPARPWGIDDCGSFVEQANVPDDLLTSPNGVPIEAFFAGPRGRRASVWQLENILHSGYDNLLANGLRRSRPTGSFGARCDYCSGPSTCPNGTTTTVPPLDAAGAAREAAALAVFTSRCFSCHSQNAGLLQMDSTNWKAKLIGANSTQPTDQLLVSPGNAAASYLMAKLDSSTAILPNGKRRMPPGSQLSASDRDKIRAWINGLHVSSGCASCVGVTCEADRLEGDAAFAFLTAGRLVENTWDEVVGAPLTIANYFPRNEAQRDILGSLTENQFVPSGWSMQRLLTHIMTTEYFNRLPPSRNTGPSAYELPTFIDPWVAGDPRLPPIALPGTPPGSAVAPSPDPAYDPNAEANRPRHFNSVADGVHRYSPRSLLQSVHKALGWPAPKREASTEYPNNDLRKSIGQFYRDAEPGFREVGFQGLLNWEQVHGRCNKPLNHTGDDWIDRLVATIPAFNASNPSDRARLRDVVLALKDRLLADASLQTSAPTDLSQDEAAVYAALFGAALTSEPDLSTAASADAFKQKVRASCGILLETPQFMLAGTAPTQLGERPRLQVCLPGEPCGYRAVCDSYVAPMARLGYNVTCLDDSLTASPMPSPIVRIRDFCPESLCGVVPLRVRDIDRCLTEPRSCFGQPPACDPRCAKVDCCGGPLPPIEGREMFLFWADGGRVANASAVRVLRSDKTTLEPLAAGDELHTGEVLILQAESQLEIKTPEGGFRTPDGGLGTHGNGKFWVVQITGSQAPAHGEMLALRFAQPVEPVPNEVGLELANKAYWLANGEAGIATVPRQRKAPSNLPGRAKRPPLTPMAPNWERAMPFNQRRNRQ
ncbi:MAG TPA: c-type cytochrome [Pyrinomonadaceae bacterium]